MIPKILPNLCQVSWLAEGKGDFSWPCTRDRMLEAWWNGRIWEIFFEVESVGFSFGAIVVPVVVWYWGNWEVWKLWARRGDWEGEERRKGKKEREERDGVVC